jgi:argininosuccinate lyase
MPQKRNPDGLELARGSAARFIGDLTASLTLLKALPTGYNKDLQEDKRLLFSTADALAKLLPATRDTVAGLSFQQRALEKAAADESLLATDLADALVTRGVPFREAHSAVGRLLRGAEAEGVAPSQLDDETWGRAHPAFLTGGRPPFSAQASVDAHRAAGGTAKPAVLEQLDLARAALERN